MLLGTLPEDKDRLLSMVVWLKSRANSAMTQRLVSFIERNEAGAIAECIIRLSRIASNHERDAVALLEFSKLFPRPWTLDFKLAAMRISLRTGNFGFFDELYVQSVEETSLAIEIDSRRLWHFLRLYPDDRCLKVWPRKIELPLFKEDVDALLAECGHPSRGHPHADEILVRKKALNQILKRMCVRASVEGYVYLRDRLIKLGYTAYLDRDLPAIFSECCQKVNIEGAEFCRNYARRQKRDKEPGVVEAVKKSVLTLCRMTESLTSVRLLQNMLAWWAIDVPALETALLESLKAGKLESAAAIYGANRNKLRPVLDRYLRQVSTSREFRHDSFEFALKQVHSRKTAEVCLENAALNGLHGAVLALLEHIGDLSSEVAIRRVLKKVTSSNGWNCCASRIQRVLDEIKNK
jgi:hypothetical protein